MMTDNSILVNNTTNKFQQYFFCYFIIIVLFFIAALRPFNVGTDTLDYVQGYVNPNISIQNRNIGFNIFSQILRIFSTDPRFFLFSVAFIIQFFIIRSILKYTKYPLFATIIYSLLFYCYSLNILRQFIVTAIFYYFGIEYIIKSKFVAFTVLIAILFTIHEMSLILYPLYFFSRKLLSPILYVILWAISMVFLFFNQIVSITSVFENIDSILRIFISSLPNYFSESDRLIIEDVSLYGVMLDQVVLIFSFYSLFYTKKLEINIKTITFFNIYFLGIVFQNIFVSINFIQRTSLLFLFANIFLASNLFSKSNIRIVYILFLCLLFYRRFVMNGISGVF